MGQGVGEPRQNRHLGRLERRVLRFEMAVEVDSGAAVGPEYAVVHPVLLGPSLRYFEVFILLFESSKEQVG